MSDLRIALVAEGPTDAAVIGAALKALLPRPFVLTLLQPEPVRPKLGTGWGGVLRWCIEFASRGSARLEDDPTLLGFDLFVIHVDADVSEQTYADVSDSIAELASQRGWPCLPIVAPCPPAAESASAVGRCVLSWLGIQTLGAKTVLCLPSKASDAWLAAAILDDRHHLLTNLECNKNLEAQLAALPKGKRLRKAIVEYRARERDVTDAWAVVRQRCSQADQFSLAVVALMA